MNSKKKCAALCIAAALIFLLGVTRGIGGIINLLSDDKTLEALNYSTMLLALLVIGFIILSAAAIITAIAIFEHNKKYILAGAFLTLIFVVSGAVNKNLVFYKTTDYGTIINIIAAVIIISLLVLGKRILDKTKGV
ncbi:MAG: hypothetical protein Q8M94_18775 [Ignavibacteria bacterium]|nr:hypothetical protein [Ignavibacteria bacterium]